MSLHHAQIVFRGVVRTACIASVVSLSAFGIVSSASAATTHFGPVAPPVAVGQKPVAVAIDDNLNTAGHKQVYVANSDSDSISVIDATTRLVTNTIPLVTGADPSAITINQADDLVFVAEYGLDAVLVIGGKTHSTLTYTKVGSKPDALAWDSVQHRVYVADYGDGTFTALADRTGGYLGSVGVGSGANSKPEGIAFDSKANRIVVAAQGDNKVYLIDGSKGTVTASPTTFHSPNAVAVNSQSGEAYVANYDSNTITVIDTTDGTEAIGSPITVGNNPNALAVDETTNAVYVANLNSSVSVITPSKTSTDLDVATVELPGDHPSGIAVDPATGDVYVSNQGTGVDSVSILGTVVSPTITSGAPSAATVGDPYNFQFTATGTPSEITYSATGDLPAGFRLVNGQLVGTPTASGSFTFTLHASNGVDPEATMQYTLTVNPVSPPTTPTPIPTPAATGGATTTGSVPYLPQVAG
ncbi:YncE family protein [Subtercola endophyticus]|uniref:YncE family protein n=1 Tax=Subtercola endophyticus TaxID=2895559 RepID=UPI001E36F074|nr:YncE family protein [Subtercola endophyticus]UFS58878.1 YncE family protein [Subtercola endophyticus]